jgi:hypothetical protein
MKALTKTTAKHEPMVFTTSWSTADGEFVGTYQAFTKLVPDQWGQQAPGFGRRLGTLLDIADEIGCTFRRATSNELAVSLGKKPFGTAVGKQQAALEVWRMVVPDGQFEPSIMIRFGSIKLQGIPHRVITPSKADQTMHFTIWAASPNDHDSNQMVDTFKADPCPACVLTVQMRACLCDFVNVEV